MLSSFALKYVTLWLNVLWVSFHVVFNYGNSTVKYSNKSLLYLSAYYVYWYSNKGTCSLFFIVKVNWECKIAIELLYIDKITVIWYHNPCNQSVCVYTCVLSMKSGGRVMTNNTIETLCHNPPSPLRHHGGELQQHQVWNEKEDVKHRPVPHLLLQRRGVQRHADVHTLR